MFDIPWSDLIPFVAFGVVVADASVAIRGDLSGFHRDLRGAESATGGFRSRMKNLLSPRNVIGAAGLFGIGFGVKQLVSFAGDAAAAYGELRQTVQTVDGIFGDSAVVIEDWADRAASSAGLSKREVMEAASVMGQTLRNMGFDADDAAQKVVDLQQRAADMALAFGKDPQDAILAISAALRGERDTIEKFGVSLTESLVQARIDTLGLSTATPELERYAKAVATLDLVMEQTETSAGRFASNQDEVAVKLAQAEANAANFQDSFGQMVTEIQNGAFIVGDTVVGNLDAFAMNFGDQHVRILAMADEMGISFSEMKELIIADMQETGRGFEESVDHIKVSMDSAKLETREAAWEMMQGIQSAIHNGAEEIEPEIERLASMPTEALRDEYNAIRIAAYESQVAYALGLMDGQNEPQVAFDAAMKLVEEEMTEAEEVARLKGQLMTLQHAAGVASAEGKAASVNAINATIALITDRLEYLTGVAYSSGGNLAHSYAAGIVNNLGVVHDAARSLGGALGSQIRIESEPPDHSSPLYGHMKWGGNFVKDITDGIYGELGTGSAAAGALAGALVPSLAGGAGGLPGGAGSGQTIQNFNLSVNGVPYQVRSPEEMLEALQELGVMSEGRL